MSTSPLPERASLEYLKKLARERLQHLRRTAPDAKLAHALLDIAREHGFSSWRSLKAHVEEQRRTRVTAFIEACLTGATAVVAAALDGDGSLARARDLHGVTGLHAAAVAGHADLARLLLRHGAEPDAREQGDHATPLHFAAGHGHPDVVRVLLDAGADVHGAGDLHEADVIGWATSISAPASIRWEVLPLLLERGARHHVFSAMAVGDTEAIKRLVEENPDALDRRMSRFEQLQTPLHFAITRQRHDLLDLLVDLGADLEARDLSGRTPLEAAMMRGDHEAMRQLRDAGAQLPHTGDVTDFTTRMSALAGSVRKGVPMIAVSDVAATLAWYASIGFTELSRYDDGAGPDFGMVSFGGAEVMLVLRDRPGPHDVTLWFYTDRVDDLYATLKGRQLQVAQAALAGTPADGPHVEFAQNIEDMFYGARQFSIRDPNGYELYFIGSSRK